MIRLFTFHGLARHCCGKVRKTHDYNFFFLDQSFESWAQIDYNCIINFMTSATSAPVCDAKSPLTNTSCAFNLRLLHSIDLLSFNLQGGIFCKANFKRFQMKDVGAGQYLVELQNNRVEVIQFSCPIKTWSFRIIIKHLMSNQFL